MEHTPFEYGGLYFIPERQFEPQGQYHRRIPLSRMGHRKRLRHFPLCGEWAAVRPLRGRLAALQRKARPGEGAGT